MMTDELILMLDGFEARTGKPPTKIICGEAAFEKLRREATDDWGADRYLEPNNRGGRRQTCCHNRHGYVGHFMGIPIQVILDNNVLENDKVYVLNEPVEDYYPLKGFDRYYYGQWNTAVQKEEELADISEDALMSVLNGGGFSAVS